MSCAAQGGKFPPWTGTVAPAAADDHKYSITKAALRLESSLVERERESCARVADEYSKETLSTDPGGIARIIAGRIRDRVTATEAESAVAAHARLIDAAPEIFAALKLAEGHLLEFLRDKKWHPIGDCPVLRFVQTAIAKVTGAEYRRGPEEADCWRESP